MEIHKLNMGIYRNKKKKTISITIIVLVLNLLLFIFNPRHLHAQILSLSITPPIYEVFIKPGNEMSLKYILTNNGNPTIISANIIPFTPSNDLGNVELKDDLSEYDPLKISKWFKLEGENVKLGEKFSLGKGEKKEITLTISPQKDAYQGDYYLTLLFTTSNKEKINQIGPSSNAKIGTNILLTKESKN